MAKKRKRQTLYTALTAADLGAANAMGYTPAEYEAAFPTVGAQQAASGRNRVASEVAQYPLQGPGIPGQPSGTAGYVTGVADPKKTNKPKPQPKETFGQAEDQAINQMFQGLLGQFTSGENIVNPYISGANSGQAASNAQALANHFAGGGIASPDQNVAGILNKDAQAYAAANQAGQQGIANALGQVNTANQAAANVSPYGQLLNALASKAQYNIVYQGAQPNVASSPQFVQEALASANQYQPSGVTGASPVGTAPSPVTTGSGSAVPPSTTVSSSAGG